MTDKNRQKGNESVGEKSDGLAGDAREVLSTQKGPAKAWCRICEAVTPCSWRWNDDTCADLCCDACHNIHVCIHEFSDSDSQRLEALARAVMHDHIYHDTLAARVAELESRPAPEALGAAQTWQPIETAPKDGTEILLYAPPTMYEGSSVSERVTAGKWHEWVETSAEYHATTGEYLGRYEQDSGAFWLSWDGGFTEEYPPTHWMPLPTPPATTAKDQS